MIADPQLDPLSSATVMFIYEKTENNGTFYFQIKKKFQVFMNMEITCLDCSCLTYRFF